MKARAFRLTTVFVLCLMVIAGPVLQVRGATTIYVPDDHGTIQEAVDAAVAGDTIIVRDGTYPENVDVDTSVTIQSENGPASTRVQAATPHDHVLDVQADNVTISGFTAENATGSGKAGISLDGRQGCEIKNNVVRNNSTGIYLRDSSGNTVTGNTAESITCHGIHLTTSSDNDIRDNTAGSNDSGIYLYGSSGNNVTANRARDNALYGIRLMASSNDNTVTGNAAERNQYGIYLSSSEDNEVASNNATDNNSEGIRLHSSNGNTLASNNASANSRGIWLESSTGNTITDNDASSNGQDGLGLASASNDNTVRDNDTCSNTNSCGIWVRSSHGNTVEDNTANANGFAGIELYDGCTGTTIGGNDAIGNGEDGILLWLSNNNAVADNDANSNTKRGIHLRSSNGNNVTGSNAFSNGSYGIHLESSSSGNTVRSNNVSSNTNHGIYLSPSTGNLIYNNYFGNAANAWDTGDNTWNVAKTPGTNIIGGPYLGGNYWSDYAGQDLDGDGLGDTPYDVPGGGAQDELPLLDPSPNLVVTEKSEAWIDVGAGTYNVTYTVANRGGVAAEASRTCIYVDDVEVASTPCPALAPDQSTTATVIGFTLSGGTDTIKVCADNDGDVAESNEADNCLENSWGTLMRGVTAEVDCDQPVPGATVTLKKDGVEVGSTVSDGDGSYSLPVAETGDYDVIAGKAGYKDQTESITVAQLGQEYELDFIGDSGLVPSAPDMSYVLKCVNRWLFPPDEECGLTMSTVLRAVNAWLFPV